MLNSRAWKIIIIVIIIIRVVAVEGHGLRPHPQHLQERQVVQIYRARRSEGAGGREYGCYLPHRRLPKDQPCLGDLQGVEIIPSAAPNCYQTHTMSQASSFKRLNELLDVELAGFALPIRWRQQQ